MVWGELVHKNKLVVKWHGQVVSTLDLATPHWAAHHCVGISSSLRVSTDKCEKATSPECSPTHEKARVCAIMPLWLAHIKEHVWTVRTCPTTILLPPRCECVHNVQLWRQKRKKRYCLILDGAPVCSPRSWSGRRWLPLNDTENSQNWAVIN